MILENLAVFKKGFFTKDMAIFENLVIFDNLAIFENLEIFENSNIQGLSQIIINT